MRAIRMLPAMLVYAVVDDSLSRHLLGDSIDVFVRREGAERFFEEIRGDIRDSRSRCGSKSASSRRVGGTSR
jgi:hypothetical protein